MALGQDEQYGRSTKKKPVYADVTEYPKFLYKFDRTFVLVNSKAEEAERLAENKKGEVIWATSPAAFGVETAPSLPVPSERPGTW